MPRKSSDLVIVQQQIEETTAQVNSPEEVESGESDDNVHPVERIVADRIKKGQTEYRILWAERTKTGRPQYQWLESGDVGVALIEDWEAGKEEREKEQRRKQAKQAEERFWKQRAAEDARKTLEKEREARLSKRKAARQTSGNSTSKSGQRLTSRESEEAADSSQFSLFGPVLQPGPKRRRRGVVSDPEDSEPESSVQSRSLSIDTGRSKGLAQKLTPALGFAEHPIEAGQSHIIVQHPATVGQFQGVAITRPEGISLEDYERFSSSFAPSSIPESGQENLTATSGSPAPSTFNFQPPPTSAVDGRLIIPDSQSQGTGVVQGSGNPTQLQHGPDHHWSEQSPSAGDHSRKESPSTRSIETTKTGAWSAENISSIIETPVRVPFIPNKSSPAGSLFAQLPNTSTTSASSSESPISSNSAGQNSTHIDNIPSTDQSNSVQPVSIAEEPTDQSGNQSSSYLPTSTAENTSTLVATGSSNHQSPPDSREEADRSESVISEEQLPARYEAVLHEQFNTNLQIPNTEAAKDTQSISTLEESFPVPSVDVSQASIERPQSANSTSHKVSAQIQSEIEYSNQEPQTGEPWNFSPISEGARGVFESQTPYLPTQHTTTPGPNTHQEFNIGTPPQASYHDIEIKTPALAETPKQLVEQASTDLGVLQSQSQQHQLEHSARHTDEQTSRDSSASESGLEIVEDTTKSTDLHEQPKSDPIRLQTSQTNGVQGESLSFLDSHMKDAIYINAPLRTTYSVATPPLDTQSIESQPIEYQSAASQAIEYHTTEVVDIHSQVVNSLATDLQTVDSQAVDSPDVDSQVAISRDVDSGIVDSLAIDSQAIETVEDDLELIGDQPISTLPVQPSTVDVTAGSKAILEEGQSVDAQGLQSAQQSASSSEKSPSARLPQSEAAAKHPQDWGSQGYITNSVELVDDNTVMSEVPSSLPGPPSQFSSRITESIMPPRPETPSQMCLISPTTPESSIQEGLERVDFATLRQRELTAARERRKLEQSQTPDIFDFKPISLRRAPREGRSTGSPLPRLPAKSTNSPEAINRASSSDGTPRLPTTSQGTVLNPTQKSYDDSGPSTDLGSSLAVHHSTQNDFFVPVAFTDLQRQLYRDTMLLRAESIQQFVDEVEASPQLAQDIQQLVEQLQGVTLHPDLISIDPLTQEQIASQTQSEWDARSSVKFGVLRNIIDCAIGAEKHIVVFAKSGASSDMMETFLRGCKVSYSRPEAHRSSQCPRGPLSITLLRTGGQQIVDRADLVVGLDETFDINDPQVLQVRKQMLNVGHLCPVVCLVVPCSVEHLQRHLPTHMAQIQRLRMLVLHAAKLKDRAGVVAPTTMNHDGLARHIARFLLAGPNATLTLPSVDEIELPNLSDSQSTTLSDFSTAEEANRKRKRDVTSDDVQIKESVMKKPRSQSPTLYDEPSPIGRQAPATSLGAGIARSDEHMELPQIQNTNATHISTSTDQESSLHNHLSTLELAMASLQTRFEDQGQELRTVRGQLLTAATALSAAETRKASLSNIIMELKAERSALQEQLSVARQELSGSVNADIRELEELRAKARHVDELENKLSKLTKSHDETLNFVNSKYQEASGKAYEHSQAVQSLEIENEELRRKASDEAVKLRTLYQQHSGQLAQSELDRVIAERDQMRKHMQSLAEENRQMKERLEKRAGMSLSTRASSLPPKGVGMPPKSPGTAPGPSALSRGLPSALGKGAMSASSSRASSRQGSPARGMTARSTAAILQERLARH